MDMGLPLDYLGTLAALCSYGYADMHTHIPVKRWGIVPPASEPKPDRAGRSLPQWAIDLKLRRVALGKSQEKVALDSGILNQTTVSELEGARYEIGNLTAARLAGLARGLNWTVAELEHHLSLDFGLGESRPLTHAERRGWVLPDEDEEPEIPEALLLAAQKYGHGENAPLAERRWLLELADLDFREEPETPEDWLAIYSRLSKLIDPKAIN